MMLLLALGFVLIPVFEGQAQGAPQNFDCNQAALTYFLNPADCQALVDLYNSTGGPEWITATNWLDPAVSPCNWFGVFCNNGKTTANGIIAGCPRQSYTFSQDFDRVVVLCLEGLDANGNNMVGPLPASFSNLAELRELWIGNSPQLTNLEVIGTLPNLYELVLRNMRLTTMPAVWPPDGVTPSPIVALSLDSNRLTTLPPEIGRFTNAKGLSALNNLLTSLPPEIGDMTSLEGLGLWRNSLTTLPPEIGNLTNLKEIVAFDNDLSSLPSEMANLDNIGSLRLEINRFTTIPEVFMEMDGLKGIALADNAITHIPSWVNATELGGWTSFNISNNAINAQRDVNGDPLYPDVISRASLEFLDALYENTTWPIAQWHAPVNFTAQVTEATADEPGRLSFSWDLLDEERRNVPGSYQIACADAGSAPFSDAARYLATTIDLLTDTLTMNGLGAGSYDCAIRTLRGPRLIVSSLTFSSEPSGVIAVVVNSDMAVPNDRPGKAAPITDPQYEYALGDFNRARVSKTALPAPTCAKVGSMKSVFFSIPASESALRGHERGPVQFVARDVRIEAGGASDFDLDGKFFIDTVIAVYRRNPNKTWTQIACNDNRPGTKASKLNAALNPARDHRVVVWGKRVNQQGAILRNLLVQAFQVYIKNGGFEGRKSNQPLVPQRWEYLEDGVVVTPPPNLLVCNTPRVYDGRCSLRIRGIEDKLVVVRGQAVPEALERLARCDKVKLEIRLLRRNLYDGELEYSNGWKQHPTAHLVVTYPDETTDLVSINIIRGSDTVYQEAETATITLRDTPQNLQVDLRMDHAQGAVFFDDIVVETRKAPGTDCTLPPVPPDIVEPVPLPAAPDDLLRSN